MAVLTAAGTRVEYLVTGQGEPVTVFAHGLAGSIPETRPFGSGVVGSKAFLHFRGHGASSAPDSPWTYDALADELRAVADEVGASRALGVSLGAGTLLHVVAAQPARFERLVLALPAAIDQPRSDPAVRRMQQMADHIDRGDLAAVADVLVQEQPVAARSRDDVRVWADKQAQRLAESSVTRALRELPSQCPLTDRGVLAEVRCPVLVIAQEDDEAHPVEIAKELTDALPRAELEVFDDGGVLWGHRRTLRELIGGFLHDDADHRHQG